MSVMGTSKVLAGDTSEARAADRCAGVASGVAAITERSPDRLDGSLHEPAPATARGDVLDEHERAPGRPRALRAAPGRGSPGST
jgi:hypothetical protein